MDMALEQQSTIPLSDPASQRYLRFARGGDVAEIDALLKEHLDRGYTQARRLLGPSSDADDAVQEAVLQLLRGAKRYDGTVSFAVCWARLVHVACRRAQVSRARRHRHENKARTMADTIAKASDDATAAVAAAEAVRKSVQGLPERDQAAIDLHYFAGLSQRDAATAMGVSESAFAMRLHRARERLQARLAREGIAVGGAALTVALISAPTFGAPAALALSASKLTASAAGGAALPATTLPIGFIQGSFSFMQMHPIMTACAVVSLLITGSLGLSALEQAPAPVPRKDAVYWQGPAIELLRYVDPKMPLRMAVDLDSVKAAMAATKPTSMLEDPAIVPTVRHIAKQLEIVQAFNSDEFPPLWQYWQAAHGITVSGDLRVDESGLHTPDDGLAIFFDVGQHLAAMKEWSLALPWRQIPSEVGSFTGFEFSEKYAWLFSESHSALGGKRQIVAATKRAAAKPEVPAAWLGAPINMYLDVSHIFRLLDKLDRDKSDPLGIGAWLPSWRTANPAVSVEMVPKDGLWQISTGLTGLRGLPFKPLRADIASLITDKRLGGIALAIDPAFLDKMAAQGGVLDGVVPAGLSLSGDIAFFAGEAAPFPHMTLVLGITDAEKCAKALPDILKKLQASPESGKQNRWTALSPLGLVSIAVIDGRLIATTVPDGIDMLSKVPSAGRGADSPCCMMTLDLPVIARTWLPLAYAAVDVKPHLLPEFSIPIIRELLFSSYPWLMSGHDDQHPLTTLSAYVDSQLDHRSKQLLNGIPDITAGSLARRRMMNGLSGNLDHILDACLTIYTDAAKDQNGNYQPGTKNLLVYRLSDGLHIADTWINHDPMAVLTAAQFAERIAGLHRLVGPEPDKLEILPVVSDEFPTFDRRWLPDLQAVVRHLPRYNMTARNTPDGLQVHEEVLPLAGGALLVGALRFIGDEYSLKSQYYRERDRLLKPSVEQRNKAKIEVLKRFTGILIGRHRAGPWELPSSPGQLVVEGRFTLEEFAPLFAGKTPTLGQLDELGHWDAKDWANSTWRVEIEDGWYVHVSTRGIRITCSSEYPWLTQPVHVDAITTPGVELLAPPASDF
jgi:RNA polymerase sigma factor (sigma-70 family)